jgi:ATP-dependent Clp protease protease subunit
MKKIIIEGVIGYDVTVKDVRDALSEASSEDVVVNIASPGGAISEGLKIYNELKNYKGRVDTHLTGTVASMATYIAMVGDKRTAENNAVFMIHNGWGFAVGDHRDMFKIGNHLESLSNMLAKEYAVKSGTQLDEIRAAMDEETYYYGDEIAEAGFVHEMVGDIEPEDRAEAVAMAELFVEECQAKVSEPDAVKKDIAALSNMMAYNDDHKNENPKNKKKEKIMNLAELKEKYPDLCNAIRDEANADGVQAGVTQERERVKGLTEMRSKFKKEHSQKVIDAAIAEGHDHAEVSINLMAADQAAEELATQKDTDTDTGYNAGSDDVPEMKDGIMTHQDHADAQSKEIADMLGLGGK